MTSIYIWRKLTMGWIKQPLHLKITFKLKPKKKLSTQVHACKDKSKTLLSRFLWLQCLAGDKDFKRG